MLWLVGQLPPDSALAASMRGGAQHRPWTPQLHVLAGIANLLHMANRQRAGKRTREPLISPPDTKREPRVVSVAEIAARQRRSRTDTPSTDTPSTAGR